MLRKKQRENSASQRVLAKNRVNSSQHGSNTTSSVNNRTNSSSRLAATRKSNTKQENKTPTSAPFSPKVSRAKKSERTRLPFENFYGGQKGIHSKVLQLI